MRHSSDCLSLNEVQLKYLFLNFPCLGLVHSSHMRLLASALLRDVSTISIMAGNIIALQWSTVPWPMEETKSWFFTLPSLLWLSYLSFQEKQTTLFNLPRFWSCYLKVKAVVETTKGLMTQLVLFSKTPKTIIWRRILFGRIDDAWCDKEHGL